MGAPIDPKPLDYETDETSPEERRRIPDGYLGHRAEPDVAEGCDQPVDLPTSWVSIAAALCAACWPLAWAVLIVSGMTLGDGALWNAAGLAIAVVPFVSLAVSIVAAIRTRLSRSVGGFDLAMLSLAFSFLWVVCWSLLAFVGHLSKKAWGG